MFHQNRTSMAERYGLLVMHTYITPGKCKFSYEKAKLRQKINQGCPIVELSQTKSKKLRTPVKILPVTTSLPFSHSQGTFSPKKKIVRIMNKNQPKLPKTRGRDATSTLTRYQKEAIIALYCPKKNAVVNVLPTVLSQTDARADLEQKKPEVILSNNNNKAGFDIVEKIIKTCSTKRMSRQLPLPLFA